MITTLPATTSVNLLPQPLFALGIDVGSEQCSGCLIQPDKSVVIKAFDFANNQNGYERLLSKLSQIDCQPAQILIGLEATSRYWENLFHFLQAQGYQLQLLHPAQTHEYACKRRLRAKTDHLDANSIARLLFSGEVRPAYVPNELITTYRELVRLHTNLTDEATRYRNEIHALLVVLFPEFTQLFADPARQTALALLKRYPSAQSIADAGVEQLTSFFKELAPHRYGPKFAQRLVELAKDSVASGLAVGVRSRSLAILCDQLSHTLENLAQLEGEIAALVGSDEAVAGLCTVSEFGLKAVAVIRAELGEVARFKRSDEVVAYVGLDLTVKQSGKWRGQTKLSKQGSGLLRRILYMAALNCLRLKSSAFKDYYQAMAARGLKGRKALMAVMRKMLVVAFRLLKSGEEYNPNKVWVEPLSKLPKEQNPKNAQLAAAGA